MSDEDSDFYAGMTIVLMILAVIGFTVAGFLQYGWAGGFAVFGGSCLAMAILAPLTMLFKD